jgi:hypothetical protein
MYYLSAPWVKIQGSCSWHLLCNFKLEAYNCSQRGGGDFWDLKGIAGTDGYSQVPEDIAILESLDQDSDFQAAINSVKWPMYSN